MAIKSKFKVNVGRKSKVIIDWRDKPENYSNEAKKHIISVISDRYSIPKESVKVSFTPLRYNENGELMDVSTDVINNIQDPKFQIKLFSDYISENGIVSIDFDFIKKIDAEINSKIDYDVYDKYRKYEIEWLEWDNFLSYGPNNRFDFSTIKGLTLVSGFPGNMSGKTTFTRDIISFLLFGKSQKPYTLAECFNKFSDAKFFRVAGGIKIDGVSYVIDRTVKRSKKRNGDWGDASQEVKYYEILNGEKEEIVDYTKNNQGEHSIKTNKIIKEAIGSEKDFNMIISATGNDLDSLIDVGSSEKGRLLSKWIGLFPLEEKDGLAKKAFKEFESKLKSKIYDKNDLENNNSQLSARIDENKNKIKGYELRISELERLIKDEQAVKDSLLGSKRSVDESLLKMDITTVNRRLSDIEASANKKKAELEHNNSLYQAVKDVVFSNDDYKNLFSEDKRMEILLSNYRNEINSLRLTNKNLTESERCPTCHRKYDGADNSKFVSDNENKIEELIKLGISLSESIKENKNKISEMEVLKGKYDQKLKLENVIQVIPIQIENLRSEYRELKSKLKEYDLNKDTIDSNNRINIAVTNCNAKLHSFDTENLSIIRDTDRLVRDNEENLKTIEKNKVLINEIESEHIKIRSWNTYLEMVGKNGISKMVLKKTLPMINSELSRMLDDVCDFDIEVVLTDKNEVMFNIIKDGVASDLGGASGFEKTASALALRCVLGNISTMPRPNFIALDEILGKVAKENYDNMRNLYSKIENNYQFILHISHLDDIKDWHKGNVVITKKDNLSSIKII